jgi:hypothetical protein
LPRAQTATVLRGAGDLAVGQLDPPAVLAGFAVAQLARFTLEEGDLAGVQRGHDWYRIRLGIEAGAHPGQRQGEQARGNPRLKSGPDLVGYQPRATTCSSGVDIGQACGGTFVRCSVPVYSGWCGTHSSTTRVHPSSRISSCWRVVLPQAGGALRITALEGGDMSGSSFRWVFLPYCLIRQDDGSYVVCNRRYKPVGDARTEFVDYEQRVKVRIKGLTPARAARLDHAGREHLDRIYLYADGCVPTDSQADWDAYSKRLQLLANLEVEPLQD